MAPKISLTLTDEAARLQVLDKLGILDTPAEKAYDDLTALAALICGTPVSLISLVGEDRQFFKSAHNSSAYGTPRDQSFCAHTLGTRETLVVEDASQDARFAHNPLVMADPSIRFYAGAPIFGEDGHVLGTLCVLDHKPRTLSPEQKQAIEALARQATELLHQRSLVQQHQRSAEELQTKTLQLGLAVEAGKLGVFTWDLREDAPVWENDRMYAIFGRTREQGSLSMDQFVSEVVAPEDLQSFLDSGALPKQAGDRLQWIGRMRHPDGTTHWIEILGLTEKNPSGQLVLVGTVADVSEEKRKEFAAQVDRERLDFALAGGNASTFDWFPGEDFIHWGGVDPFGSPAEQMSTIGQVFEIIHPEDHAKVSQGLSDAVDLGKDYACDFRAFWPDGSMHWVRGIGRLLHDNSDAPRRFVGVNFDVTERKLAEEALLQGEKLAAVGRLASVISHEINNPLEAVTNLLYIVRMSEHLSQQDKDHLEIADRELARVSQITAQTLRFHRNIINPGPIDASAMVQELLALYNTRLTASDITVRLDLGKNVTFSAYEGDIRQVLNNLVGNAFDAMRKGGVLSIRTQCATDPKTGQKGAAITIGETGTGISAEAQQRIFQAFQSTKGIHGTGLGLWISKRIIHKHKGHLWFRSSTGERHGTVFRLWVPLDVAQTASEGWA